MCAGNPHYTPEVSTKVMIVNFAVKQQGLEAQLLNTVVKQERADLDRQKNELVLKVAQGKRTQVSTSTKLLLCSTTSDQALAHGDSSAFLQLEAAHDMFATKTEQCYLCLAVANLRLQ